jgi:proteasome lid subunit RPN8/RPN11
MELDSLRNIDIQNSMPNVQFPAIEFFPHEKFLYVKINIKSYVINPSRENLMLYQGFLFLVKPKISPPSKFILGADFKTVFNFLFEFEIPTKSLPRIQLISEFPELFHPHFGRRNFSEAVEWIDYKEVDDNEMEKDLGSYILRVARSLMYEEGYVEPNAKRIGNKKAARWYISKCQAGIFPTSDIQLPSGKKFEIKSAQNSSFQPLVNRQVKFEVQESQPRYSPLVKVKPNFSLISQLSSNFIESGARHSPKHEFFIEYSAFESIAHHIQWDRQTDDNIVEQGGILLGNSFRDPDTDIVYAVVEKAISGRLARGTASYLEVTHETWKEMLDDVDNQETNLQVIGWYHTHPNNLGVFMSGTDCATQSRLFGNDWQFAIVLNPHKKIWKAFYGYDSHECNGYVIKENTPDLL